MKRAERRSRLRLPAQLPAGAARPSRPGRSLARLLYPVRREALQDLDLFFQFFYALAQPALFFQLGLFSVAELGIGVAHPIAEGRVVDPELFCYLRDRAS